MTGESVDFFKNLNLLLQTVPDELQIVGYTASQRADRKSIIDMIKFSMMELALTANP